MDLFRTAPFSFFLYHEAMRFIAATLFVLGIPFALVAWIPMLGGPAAFIEEFAAGRTAQALGVILFWPLIAGQIALGYYIWSRWLKIALKFAIPSRRFWLIALAQHVVWLVIGVVSHLQHDPIPKAILWHAALVSLVCAVASFAAEKQVAVSR